MVEKAFQITQALQRLRYGGGIVGRLVIVVGYGFRVVPPRQHEQTIQIELDLRVRGRGAGGDEVDDQPCKPPVRHPSP